MFWTIALGIVVALAVGAWWLTGYLQRRQAARDRASAQWTVTEARWIPNAPPRRTGGGALGISGPPRGTPAKGGAARASEWPSAAPIVTEWSAPSDPTSYGSSAPDTYSGGGGSSGGGGASGGWDGGGSSGGDCGGGSSDGGGSCGGND